MKCLICKEEIKKNDKRRRVTCSKKCARIYRGFDMYKREELKTNESMINLAIIKRKIN